MLKATCPECEKGEKSFLVRIAASTIRTVGLPHCPLHGAMVVEEAELEEHGGGNGSEDDNPTVERLHAS